MIMSAIRKFSSIKKGDRCFNILDSFHYKNYDRAVNYKRRKWENKCIQKNICLSKINYVKTNKYLHWSGKSQQSTIDILAIFSRLLVVSRVKKAEKATLISRWKSNRILRWQLRRGIIANQFET